MLIALEKVQVRRKCIHHGSAAAFVPKHVNDTCPALWCKISSEGFKILSGKRQRQNVLRG